jgi:DNA-binding FadR family transcriptional regulator
MTDDPASVQLADHIAGQIRASRLKPGAVVASELELRSDNEAGRSVVRQAVRILEERGVAYMKRGYAGGLIVAPPNPQVAARALAIALESRMQGLEPVALLRRVTDTQLFLSGAPLLDIAACDEIRRLGDKLDGLSREEFQRVDGYQQMHRALLNLSRDPVVALAYHVTEEYGADLVPYSVIVANEGRRGHFWNLTLQMVEALIAADVTLLFDLRRRQQEVITTSWRAWEEIDSGTRVLPRISDEADTGTYSSQNSAERLAREILRDVRLLGWKTGERIGGAAELMERYSASVGALRQAVRMLEDHSAVRMERGRNGGLFIAQPDAAEAGRRAQEFLRQSDADLRGIKAFLTRLVLEAISLAPALSVQGRRDLDQAVRDVAARPGAAADKTLFKTLSVLSGHAALELFVDVFTGLLPDTGGSGSATDLELMVQSMVAGDRPKARRAFLRYARTGELVGGEGVGIRF